MLGLAPKSKRNLISLTINHQIRIGPIFKDVSYMKNNWAKFKCSIMPHFEHVMVLSGRKILRLGDPHIGGLEVCVRMEAKIISSTKDEEQDLQTHLELVSFLIGYNFRRAHIPR
ncbi:unnamed protein product [Lepeophtheirus salmonis]|uniref:(salmon louse) hypothetical protein n=1 Tax=Lepeophtheirus salmonis TaxID=72036 RepID=A0A817FE85_LEPSM|nr:unnamed protein product [Lepeophtheirus salmonis]CAG9478582.1 unnamed protein product [Lepeophtheirus salmonis]